jgi:hypothetical protein
MQATLAILFALLLGATQAALPFASAASPSKACRNCACPNRACCYDQGSRNTSSGPLAPVRQLSTEQLQLLAHYVGAIVVSLPPPSVTVPHTVSTIFSPAAVPLYYRNCTLLI